MQRLQRRCEKIEQALIPSNRVALVFVRNGHKEEDSEKQRKEYFSKWRNNHHVIFIIVTDYFELDHDYEIFIQKMRAKCPPGNCYTDWWERN